MSETGYFSRETFAFFRDLAQNNNRDWFLRNKPRYEQHVREPAQRFIIDFGRMLGDVSRHFRADPRPVGGSLFRIYRDTRFSKDKSPYKTFAGIQFRHKSGKDAHAPGFYLHLEPRNVFAGIGIWQPDSATLRQIRHYIIDNPSAWKRAVGSKSFTRRFELAGESLYRPPRGFDPDHPLIDDIKRKDFVALSRLGQQTVTRACFPEEFATLCRDGSSLVRFLCAAVGVPF
ncbi:MAG: DUF2461 domain-containing protein [Candidatus Latescibacterota bacterium]|nr:MAG: DUF2461 domain-containing protein [Candidatus Latescibacterota bacterium]